MSIIQLKNGNFKNTDTDEVLPKSEFTFIAMPKKLKIEGWFMAFQEAFIYMAKDKSLTLTPRRVLDYLLGILDFDNKIIVCQSQIAEELNLYRSDVSSAIRTLIQKGYIEKGPKSGRSYTYRLSTDFGYKGRVKTLLAERKNKFKVHQGGKI